MVDPQKGFTDHAGSLAKANGSDEIGPSIAVVTLLETILKGLRTGGVRTLLVRSEYVPGQFTAGRLDHPLSHLCVPNANVDCEWTNALEDFQADSVVTKHEIDAMTAPQYQAAVSRCVAQGAREICFAGFQFTTCVAETALSTRIGLKSQCPRCIVVQPLTGSRRSSYEASGRAVSRVAQTVEKLLRLDVEVVAEVPPVLRGYVACQGIV
ncbi:MAG: isochorismatase family protein [Planctomycetes bacterium]|nr:isochorismatase family protein [Planctomycetota bacterium]